mmetsp:Transcript_84321/g.188259  ORF Transcript_84321/g.188259 Transcript_84321/m.188259 type:complete len:852 (+) Transcript_84321:249-2804(+)
MPRAPPPGAAPSARHAEGQEGGEHAVALAVEGVVAVGEGVGRAVHLGRLAQRLREELAVGGGRGAVAVAPDGEHLHGRRARALRRRHLLGEEGGEGHDGAEEDHAGHLLGDDLEQRGVERDARAPAEAHEHHVPPLQARGAELALDGLHHGAAEELHVVHHVQVLVLEARAVAEVPGAVDDLGRVEVELLQALARGVLRPGEGGQARRAQRAREVLDHGVLGLGVVADPDDERARAGLVAGLQGHRQRPLGARGRHALVREEQVEPLRLELVALVLLLLAPVAAARRGLRRGAPAAALLVAGVGRLLLQRGEDQHHLGAVGGVGGAREGVADGVLADLVEHGVQGELVRAHELRDVLHDGHHLLHVRGEAVHPPGDVEAHELPAPGGEQRRRDLDGLRHAVAVDHHARVLVAGLEAVDELLAGLARGHAVEGELGQHALVPVAPAQQGHGVGEDLLGAHGDEPLADALVLRADRGRRHGARVGVLPGALGAVLALDAVQRRPGQREDAERLQLQELAELQQRAARGREVRGVEQHGVAGLELGAEDLEQRVGADDGGREADLLGRELLQDLGVDADHVVLVADEQRPRGADGPLRGELRGLGQHQHRVLLLQLLHPRAHLLDAAHARHAQADAGLVQLRVDHGVVHGHRQHPHHELVLVDGLLELTWLGLHLHRAAQGLAVGVLLRRAQHVLHRALVVELRGHLRGVEERVLHEVLVRHHHLRLVALPQPLIEALLVLAHLAALGHLVRDVHHGLLVRLLGPLLVPAAAEGPRELLLRGHLRAARGVVALALVHVREHVVGLVEQLEALRVAALVGVLRQDLGAELGADLVQRGVALHADELVVVRLGHGC